VLLSRTDVDFFLRAADESPGSAARRLHDRLQHVQALPPDVGQKVIDATPEPQIMPTDADRAVTLFNQIVTKRLRDETVAGISAR
jgi:hypothetical protein